MRLVSYRANGRWRPGIEIGDEIADVETVAARKGLRGSGDEALLSTRAVLALSDDQRRTLEDAIRSDVEPLREEGAVVGRDSVPIGPPVPDPQKIVCLGLNYHDHAEESGLQPPAAPMFFAKFANSLIGPTETISPPRGTDQVDYEAELAVVIGRRGRNIPLSEALDHVAGAMALNDVSARDLQLSNQLWTGGKAIDTFAPCGPSLVLRDEIEDLHALGLRTRVNGETLQEGTTASMIFGVPEIVAFLSRIMTLEPGDIIATGTPAGVGQSREPRRFMSPGDVVEVEVDGLGTLRNPVGPPA